MTNPSDADARGSCPRVVTAYVPEAEAPVTEGKVLVDRAVLDRLRALWEAVSRLLDQEDDDHCWRDALAELAPLVGRAGWRPRVLPEDQMRAYCERFITKLHAGEAYVTPLDEQVAKVLRERLALGCERTSSGCAQEGGVTVRHRIRLTLLDPETGTREDLGEAQIEADLG
jgi:hypothetical protein